MTCEGIFRILSKLTLRPWGQKFDLFDQFWQNGLFCTKDITKHFFIYEVLLFQFLILLSFFHKAKVNYRNFRGIQNLFTPNFPSWGAKMAPKKVQNG